MAVEARLRFAVTPPGSDRPRLDVSTSAEPTTRPVVIVTMQRPAGSVVGVQTHIRTLRRYLERTGHAVSVVTPFSLPKTVVYPVFAMRRLLDPLSARALVWWYRYWHARSLRIALARVLGELPEAVVYTHDELSTLAALQVRGDGHEIVLAMHDTRSQADAWASRQMIAAGEQAHRKMEDEERVAIDGVDRLVFVSEVQRRMLLEWFPELDGVPSAVIPNFVDVEEVDPDRVPDLDLVTIGSLEPRKNQGFLIEVLAAARKRGRSLTLTIIGEGRDLKALETLVATHDLSDSVRFTGAIPDVVKELSRHRVYVHASLQESFGISIIEAMALGLPVIAAPSGGVPELFTDGREGRYWDLEDPDAAAQLLLEVLDDHDLLRKMGEQGMARQRETFSTPVVAPRLAAFLNDGIDPGGQHLADDV